MQARLARMPTSATAGGLLHSNPSRALVGTAASSMLLAGASTAVGMQSSSQPPSSALGTVPSGMVPQPATSAQVDGGGAPLAAPGSSQVLVGNRSVPEEALQEAKVRKGARGHAITAMCLIPPGEGDPPGHLGHLWFYLSKLAAADGVACVVACVEHVAAAAVAACLPLGLSLDTPR